MTLFSLLFCTFCVQTLFLLHLHSFIMFFERWLFIQTLSFLFFLGSWSHGTYHEHFSQTCLGGLWVLGAAHITRIALAYVHLERICRFFMFSAYLMMHWHGAKGGLEKCAWLGTMTEYMRNHIYIYCSVHRLCDLLFIS